MKLKLFSLTLATLLLLHSQVSAFCGFYVAQAGTDIFNKTSKVIMARKGNQTIITMNSDFQGEIEDFAMVVPVPQVLKREDIRVVNAALFSKMDKYSAPRMAEYYDPDPCMIGTYYFNGLSGISNMAVFDSYCFTATSQAPKYTGVTIEAEYKVDEYDIVILSAKESDGLEEWLIDHGYKIPDKAHEVLYPYIKNKMKFFLVKVNTEKQKAQKFNTLRPIQISFQSDKFMLPIRLGMANSKGTQNLVVYMLSPEGRVETANYRTVKIPTDREIPTKVRENFGEFYRDLYYQAWKKEEKEAVFLEYAWDLSTSNPIKCDPCEGPPPVNQELVDAGAFWLHSKKGFDPNAKVFLTRLHLRYDREHFPQDLSFIPTPNKERFQARYVIHNPPNSNFKCGEGQQYLWKLLSKRKKEVEELAALTGWVPSDYNAYVTEFVDYINDKVKLSHFRFLDPTKKHPYDFRTVRNMRTPKPDSKTTKEINEAVYNPESSAELVESLGPVMAAVRKRNRSNNDRDGLMFAVIMSGMLMLFSMVAFHNFSEKRKPTADD